MTFARGWKRASATYRCSWCEREETIHVGLLEARCSLIDVAPEGWTWKVDPQRIDLCSSDCQAIKNRAAAVVVDLLREDKPSGKPGTYSEAFGEHLEKLRQDYLQERKERFLT